MTIQEQLGLWVAGESIHNETASECCPDFSCCKPELLAVEETRIAFKAAIDAADRDTIHAMTVEFLAALETTTDEALAADPRPPRPAHVLAVFPERFWCSACEKIRRVRACPDCGGRGVPARVIVHRRRVKK